MQLSSSDSNKLVFFCDVTNPKLKENLCVCAHACVCVCVRLPFRQPPCLSGLSVSLSGLPLMKEPGK